MNNSAVVLSPGFFVSRINALLMKKHDFSPKEKEIKNKIIDELIDFENKKSEEIERLGLRRTPRSNVKDYQKKKELG